MCPAVGERIVVAADRPQSDDAVVPAAVIEACRCLFTEIIGPDAVFFTRWTACMDGENGEKEHAKDY